MPSVSNKLSFIPFVCNAFQSSFIPPVILFEISASILCHHLNINFCGQMINLPLPVVIRKPNELLIELLIQA